MQKKKDIGSTKSLVCLVFLFFCIATQRKIHKVLFFNLASMWHNRIAFAISLGDHIYSKRAAKLAVLSIWEGQHALSPVRVILANLAHLRDYVCGRGQIALSFKCVTLHCGCLERCRGWHHVLEKTQC